MQKSYLNMMTPEEITPDMIRKEIRELDAILTKQRKKIDSLEDDKDKLLKIIVGAEDSISLHNINHKTHFTLTQVLKDDITYERKLSNLKTYMKPLLEESKHDVLLIIDDFKHSHEKYRNVLNDLTSWINEHY